MFIIPSYIYFLVNISQGLSKCLFARDKNKHLDILSVYLSETYLSVYLPETSCLSVYLPETCLCVYLSQNYLSVYLPEICLSVYLSESCLSVYIGVELVIIISYILLYNHC